MNIKIDIMYVLADILTKIEDNKIEDNKKEALFLIRKAH